MTKVQSYMSSSVICFICALFYTQKCVTVQSTFSLYAPLRCSDAAVLPAEGVVVSTPPPPIRTSQVP